MEADSLLSEKAEEIRQEWLDGKMETKTRTKTKTRLSLSLDTRSSGGYYCAHGKEDLACRLDVLLQGLKVPPRGEETWQPRSERQRS